MSPVPLYAPYPLSVGRSLGLRVIMEYGIRFCDALLWNIVTTFPMKLLGNPDGGNGGGQEGSLFFSISVEVHQSSSQ